MLMKYMRGLVCKIRYVLKFSVKRFVQMLGTIMALFGVILTIAECVQWMFESDIVYVWMHDYVVYILLGCIFIAFLKNKIQLSCEYFLKGTDVKINLKVCDVLSENAAIVIPTNTTFDTKMDDEFISVSSVQGQFQKKYFDNNLSTLDSLLEKGLEGYSYEKIDRIHSKDKKYPLGTVSKVTYNGKHYYFVAVADINEYGKTVNTKFENIQLALEGLWSQLESRGHVENLALPLLGTGRAGIKDASRKRVVQEIIFSFVASSKQRKITEKLLICVHPLDLEHKDLALAELNEYLRYMCEYRYVDESRNIEGIAINSETNDNRHNIKTVVAEEFGN